MEPELNFDFAAAGLSVVCGTEFGPKSIDMAQKTL